MRVRAALIVALAVVAFAVIALASACYEAFSDEQARGVMDPTW